jgi:hypothetical protein
LKPSIAAASAHVAGNSGFCVAHKAIMLSLSVQKSPHVPHVTGQSVPTSAAYGPAQKSPKPAHGEPKICSTKSSKSAQSGPTSPHATSSKVPAPHAAVHSAHSALCSVLHPTAAKLPSPHSVHGAHV